MDHRVHASQSVRWVSDTDVLLEKNGLVYSKTEREGLFVRPVMRAWINMVTYNDDHSQAYGDFLHLHLGYFEIPDIL